MLGLRLAVMAVVVEVIFVVVSRRAAGAVVVVVVADAVAALVEMVDYEAHRYLHSLR